MLENVIAAYLDRVAEREFDEPFMALLRAMGYTHVQYVHGQVEFGKDVIAQRVVAGASQQLAFQLKAGSLALHEWNQARAQIEQIRTNPLGHPAFDAAMPRGGILVLTGRLSPPARLDTQQYEQYAQQQGFAFEVWDRDRLLELLARTPAVGLAGFASANLVALVAGLELGKASDRDLERYARNWVPAGETFEVLIRATVEAAVIAQTARHAQRLDLACVSSYGLIRAADAALHNRSPEPEEVLAVRESAIRLFVHYGQLLWARTKNTSTPDDIVLSHANEIAMFLTYPVRCLRLFEILGLLCLSPLAEKAQSDEIAAFLVEFIRTQPGTAHPISNRWASSLIPGVLALTRARSLAIPQFLERVASWTCDWYDPDVYSGIGLARPNAPVDEESMHLLGGLAGVNLPRETGSYIETVVLDLCVALELRPTYQLIRNDFLAVEATASMVDFDDVVSQYMLSGEGGIHFLPSVDYPDEMGGRAPAHHAAPDVFLVRTGRAWDWLAIGALLRDRHSIGAIRALRP